MKPCVMKNIKYLCIAYDYLIYDYDDTETISKWT